MQKHYQNSSNMSKAEYVEMETARLRNQLKNDLMKPWGKDAETILARFHKGDGIIVTDGRIVVDSWEKDGERRYKTTVRVNRWEFPQGRQNESGEPKPAPQAQGFADIDDDDPDSELPF